MQLLTQELSAQAQAQYPLGNDMDQLVVARFFSPTSNWVWYVMNQDPEDPDYLWGIVKGFEVEIGSFSLSELECIKLPMGLSIERDLYFKPRPAREVYEALQRGEHV